MLIEWDLDILCGMVSEGLVKVGIFVMFLDVKVSCLMEFCVLMLDWWLWVIEKLVLEGILVWLMVLLVVSGLIDYEVEWIIGVGVVVGVKVVSWIMLCLLFEVLELF